MYVCYICQIILLGLNTKTIMKTKLILLLCALMGVLSTVQALTYTQTRVNDSTLFRNQTSPSSYADWNTWLNFTNDSANYSTLNLSGLYNASDFCCMTTRTTYKSSVKYIDASKVTIPAFTGEGCEKTFDAYFNQAENFQISTYSANTLPHLAFGNFSNLKKIILPPTCDSIYSTSFNNCKALDTIVITNTNKVVVIKLYKNYVGFAFYKNIMDESQLVTYSLRRADSVVVKVPRKFYADYRAKSVVGGELHYFKIVAYDEQSTNAVQLVTNNNNIKVYPTITTDVVNVTGVEPDKYISLIDLSGNVVLKTKDETQLNISSLSKGIYLVSVDGKVIQKIIKE